MGCEVAALDPRLKGLKSLEDACIILTDLGERRLDLRPELGGGGGCMIQGLKSASAGIDSKVLIPLFTRADGGAVPGDIGCMIQGLKSASDGGA